MNTARITILLDNYAAHFPEDGGVPEHLGALWQAARTCAASFDPAAEDLSGMLQRAFMDATSVINYTSSVQPLYGMYALAAPEQMTEQYRGALTILLANHGDTLLHAVIGDVAGHRECVEQCYAIRVDSELTGTTYLA